jgi:hypothetical protein
MKRTSILLGLAGGLALLFAIVGYLIGLDLAFARMANAGVKDVILTSPGEPAGVQLMTALQFAWPAIAAGIAVALDRWRSGSDPSWRAGVLYFLIPALLVGGYTALQLTWMSSVMGQSAGGVTPMFSLREFGPTARDAQLLGFVSLVMWLYVWVRKS